MRELWVVSKCPATASEDGTEEVDFGNEPGGEVECLLVE